MTGTKDFAERINDALPQTQCTRCGYPDCRAYAQAIADGSANINQCPPGGASGIARLAVITGLPAVSLNPANGVESPLRLALIDEDWCIGCTLCIKACPVDCIVGAPKLMHTVVGEQCTGCELCLPVCPVDCIAMIEVSSPKTGWAAWSAAQSAQARERYALHQQRQLREQIEQDESLAASTQAKVDDPEVVQIDSKRTIIDAALKRAKRLRDQSSA